MSKCAPIELDLAREVNGIVERSGKKGYNFLEARRHLAFYLSSAQ